MRFLHYLNAILWMINAAVWGVYAQSFVMMVVSFFVAGIAVGMARMAEAYP